MATSPPFPFLSFLKTLKASIAKSLSPISEETQVSVSAITCKLGQAETSNLSSSTLCRRLRMFWWRYLKPRWLDISLTLVKRASYGWSWFVSFQKVVLEHREDIRSFKRMERNTYRTNFLEPRNFPHLDRHLTPIRRMEWDKKKAYTGHTQLTELMTESSSNEQIFVKYVRSVRVTRSRDCSITRHTQMLLVSLSHNETDHKFFRGNWSGWKNICCEGHQLQAFVTKKGYQPRLIKLRSKVKK